MSDRHAPHLRPLREVIRDSGIRASKAFGQHFLLDLNITRKIVRSTEDLAGKTVMEVGPGPGGLTRAILETSPMELVVVEKDRRFLPALEELQDAYPDRLRILVEDALAIREPEVLSKRKDIAVISNLPYNVSTPLLLKWIYCEPWPPWWSSMTLMFQKEVAERLVSPPARKTYGRLSVAIQWRTAVKKLFDVQASAFVPPPKVTSTVVHLTPRREASSAQVAGVLETVLKHAFGQRRKMIKSSLGSVVPDLGMALERIGVADTARAEELTVENFADIAAHVVAKKT